MADILGPAQNTPFATTERPAEDRTFSTLDTWFKDCSSIEADDGTDIKASFFNGLLAQLRALWRSNGKLADAATDVIPDVGTDDNGLTKAIQQLIQRAQNSYAVDTGAANSLVVSLTPALREYKAGVKLRVKVKVTNTGATQINVNGLGLRDVKKADGSALSPGDLVANGIADLNDDGTRFQLVATHVDRTAGGGGTGFRVPIATATGTPTAIVATYSPTTATPQAGDLFSVKLIANIQGVTTFAPDSHGPYGLKDANGVDLSNKFAMSGDLLLMEFDGTNFRIISKTSALASGPPLMEPGAIGSLAFCKIYIDPSEFLASQGYGPGPLAFHLLNGWGPALGYVYGQYVYDTQMLDFASGPSSYTGLWRSLSELTLDISTNGGPYLTLMQRVA
ncbi:MAG: hypothetical protein IJ935_03105 [Afipia sp.]|nr:hypothetical protein [Afipia sp.]